MRGRRRNKKKTQTAKKSNAANKDEVYTENFIHYKKELIDINKAVFENSTNTTFAKTNEKGRLIEEEKKYINLKLYIKKLKENTIRKSESEKTVKKRDEKNEKTLDSYFRNVIRRDLIKKNLTLDDIYILRKIKNIKDLDDFEIINSVLKEMNEYFIDEDLKKHVYLHTKEINYKNLEEEEKNGEIGGSAGYHNDFINIPLQSNINIYIFANRSSYIFENSYFKKYYMDIFYERLNKFICEDKNIFMSILKKRLGNLEIKNIVECLFDRNTCLNENEYTNEILEEIIATLVLKYEDLIFSYELDTCDDMIYLRDNYKNFLNERKSLQILWENFTEMKKSFTLKKKEEFESGKYSWHTAVLVSTPSEIYLIDNNTNRYIMHLMKNNKSLKDVEMRNLPFFRKIKNLLESTKSNYMKKKFFLCQNYVYFYENPICRNFALYWIFKYLYFIKHNPQLNPFKSFKFPSLRLITPLDIGGYYITVFKDGNPKLSGHSNKIGSVEVIPRNRF